MAEDVEEAPRRIGRGLAVHLVHVGGQGLRKHVRTAHGRRAVLTGGERAERLLQLRHAAEALVVVMVVGLVACER